MTSITSVLEESASPVSNGVNLSYAIPIPKRGRGKLFLSVEVQNVHTILF